MNIKEAKEKINAILDELYDNSNDNQNNQISELTHPVGFCLVPDDIDRLPKLSIPSNHPFKAPTTVDLRDYCTPPTNQGNMPHCAGHACASWAENILWRKNDYIEDINPDEIYYEAKKIDGCGGHIESGTTLTAVLQVLLNKRIFNPDVCKVQVIYKNDDYVNSLKYAIHKMGCCLIALNIYDEFYKVNKNKTSITGRTATRKVGGHALLCCGYNKDGIIIQNSWGEQWGANSFALVTWEALKDQFLYAAVLSNCLNDLQLK